MRFPVLLRVRSLLLALSLAAPLSLIAQPASAAAPAHTNLWPEITRENKPWTRWWWPGSGVDKASLTAQLEQLAIAGVGGVEITPIYGAKGYEDRYIDFLSPKWMEMLEHTGREAKRLGLGVDMATGTGWPFGGPWIDEPNALQRATLRDGQIVGEPSRMMVKRAAPGGEGLVVDPYSPDALRKYLHKFEAPFAAFPRDLLRSQFHDSFEYFNASWTAKLPGVFREMHGYDIQQFAAHLITPRPPRNAKSPEPSASSPALATPPLDPDTLRRVKSDLRETFAKLHLEYLRTWIEWSHARGWKVRNQSHGAPANLLDLYGAVDIPETETFGSTPFPIPGLRRDRADIRTDSEQDLPEPLVIRVASSAAHVMGKPLTSSESATWLRDHWKVALAHVKPELDRILADGINHIFYHGTVFSPTDAPWPGWLFYASTQFNPNNTWWDDFGALNRYIARVQSILQRGQPDNDILLYWPFADVIDDANGLMKMFGVHDVKWMTETPTGHIARKLMEKGYTFDYVSDTQLQGTRVSGAELTTPGDTRYKVLVVPATRRMPVATLQKIAELQRAGAKILFEKLPEDVPGYGRLEQRRAQFKTALGQLTSPIITSDLLAAIAPHARREALADHNLSFVRRRSANGHDYFVTNLSARPTDAWVQLGVPATRVYVLDPVTGFFGYVATRNSQPHSVECYLQLAPGESRVLRAVEQDPYIKIAPWPVTEPAGAPLTLAGTWTITFLKGGPDLPSALTTTELKSWTELGGESAQRFGGTVRYKVEFDAPTNKADDWLLDLGDVRESARLRLNGKEYATLWSIPYRFRIGAHLKPGRNVLELDVTNLAANRIRDLDIRKVDWKIMREINFVNINYKPFDASGWPLQPSGLLGPVTLTPLRRVTFPVQ
jgi:hypothetical protein